MKRIYQLILLMCLCFLGKVQAQNTEVYSFNQRVNSLDQQEVSKLELLTFGAVSRLNIKGTSDAYLSNEDLGPIQVVDINCDQLSRLKDNSWSSQLQSVYLLSIFWESDQLLALNYSDLQQLPNLKFILIKSYDAVDQGSIQALFHDFLKSKPQSSEIEILYLQLELPN